MKILAVVFNLIATAATTCEKLYPRDDGEIVVLTKRDYCIYCQFHSQFYPYQRVAVFDTYYELIRDGTTHTIKNQGDQGFGIDNTDRHMHVPNGNNLFQAGDVLICISDQAKWLHHISGRITMIPIIQYFLNPHTSPNATNGVIDVMERSDFTVTCMDNSRNTPYSLTTYEWRDRNDELIVGTNRTNAYSPLLFTNITRASSDIYICRLWRSFFDKRDTYIIINVQFPPVILAIDSSATILKSGSTYSVNCTFDHGNPLSTTITWQRNGTTLTSNINITTTSTSSLLTIPSLQGLQDSGNYQCIANNNVYNVSSNNVTLTVQVLADPVINLMATDVSESSVRLEWTLGFNGYANISGVRVEYIATGNYHMPHSGNESFSGSTISQGIITGLQLFTNYTFNVYVINSVGESSPVQLIVITLPLVPNAPTLDSVIPDNSTSLRIMWTDNTSSYTQSMVTSYRVVYHIAGQPSTSTNVTVTVTSVILTSLMKVTNYTVTVYATNSRGEGLASNSITNMTDVGPPSAVNNLMLVPFDDSICVSWNTTVNDDGGQSISGFKLYYKYSYNTSNILAGQFGKTTSFYRIDNLPQINFYTVSIVAFNMLGGDGDDTSITTTTGVSIPTTMSINLTLTRVTAFTAFLTYTWSSSPSFSSFFLQYKPTGSGWSSSNEVNVTGMTNYMIDKLIPQTNYDARLVMSFNNNCLLEATSPINISTIVLKIIITDNGTVNGTAFVTDKVVLRCTLDTGEVPPSNVIWMRDNGSPIPSNDIMNNTLEFSNVSVTDTANYTCSFQTVSYTFTLTVIKNRTDVPNNNIEIGAVLTLSSPFVGALILFITAAFIVVIGLTLYLVRIKRNGSKSKQSTDKSEVSADVSHSVLSEKNDVDTV